MELKRFEEAAIPLRVLGLKITKAGEEPVRRLWDDASRRNVYSAGKSFTSAAVGIAIREGLLSLDEKLVDAFQNELPDVVSDNLAKAKVKDLLTMCLGQKEAFLMGGERPFYERKDWVKLSLEQPFVYEPGSHFVYNNAGPYLAGILVQRRAGCDLVHYLMPRLFEPLGISMPTWEVDPNGDTFGAGGLFLSLDELHLFGELLLQEGCWNGKQLIPREWIKEAGAKQVDNGSYGYGYLFWRGPQNSYRADGKYCQYVIVLPDKQSVITVTAECREGDKLLSLIFDELYPQL